MVRALTILVLYQLIGTVLQQGTGLPVPGAVIGLVLALGWFLKFGPPGDDLRLTAQGLLKYLGLLFVPAGVGVVNQLGMLRQNAVAILIAIGVSTALGLLVTGVTMQWFLSKREAKGHA
ncbi:CidA/LrgA family protein [Acidocella aminolytica]|uniref:Murein hydrolase control protein LrgA n=1 Tax=Acidocella aminolytica 101 = DSM 11237 TaxID=1120923 RepID=A0A0D6PFE3_9PROT|nr:CidA/LrgA family protein [Acidocella aminolytica]GAN80076.1 murein hydrolase control protein LrgA [Acidocella aminolytica 101 = DSM 11237]SHF07242.1 LrgA family protein [Acidocella aminolytica 101 = DSM 11237]